MVLIDVINVVVVAVCVTLIVAAGLWLGVLYAVDVRDRRRQRRKERERQRRAELVEEIEIDPADWWKVGRSPAFWEKHDSDGDPITESSPTDRE